MKNVLIILITLFTLVGYSQENDSLYTYDSIGEDGHYYVRHLQERHGFSFYPDFREEMMLQASIRLETLKDYLIECHNDSTHVNVGNPPYTIDIMPDGSFVRGKAKWIWTHRIPTVLGFAKFLEKEYDIKLTP